MDHAVVAGDVESPARTAAGEACKHRTTFGIDAFGSQQPFYVGRREGVEEHTLAAGDDSGQHDERVQARCRQDYHSVRVRLLQRLQQNALALVPQAADVGNQSDPASPYVALQVEEWLPSE